MKKTYLSLIALFAALQFSHAQWTNATNINNTNSGNVGIGTTNPAYKLDVNGTGNYSGNLTVSGATITATNYSGLSYPYNTAFGSGADASYTKLYAGSTSGYMSGLFVNGGSASIPNIITLNTSSSERMRVDAAGNVGIGTTSPSSKLHIAGGGRNGLKVDGTMDGTSTGKYLSLWQGSGAAGIDPIGTGVIYLGYDQSSDIFFGGSTPKGIWSANGSVGIGTTIVPSMYKLAVNGAAIATSMKVKIYDHWPDFVFLKDYKLPTLTEVKTYVDRNQHLPDMPSADEVHANGLDLGEMNRLLLKKVEELTLYLIEKDANDKKKDKKLEMQEHIIQSQQDQMELITKQLNAINKTLKIAHNSNN